MQLPAIHTGQEQELLAQVASAMRDAVIETFQTICGEAPVQRTGGESNVLVDGVIGIVSLFGDVPMSFLLGLPRPSAVRLSEQFAGFEIGFESPDMGDVVGEMANVLAGDLVARMDALGLKAQMSLPTTVAGRQLGLMLPESLLSTEMQFDSSAGPFWVKLRCPKKYLHAGKTFCALCGK